MSLSIAVYSTRDLNPLLRGACWALHAWLSALVLGPMIQYTVFAVIAVFAVKPFGFVMLGEQFSSKENRLGRVDGLDSFYCLPMLH